MFGLKKLQERKEKLYPKMVQHHLILGANMRQGILQKLQIGFMYAATAWEAASPHMEEAAHASEELEHLPHEVQKLKMDDDIIRAADQYARQHDIPFFNHWMNFSRMSQAVDIMEQAVAECERNFPKSVSLPESPAELPSTYFRELAKQTSGPSMRDR